jgi:hypothetical protein
MIGPKPLGYKKIHRNENIGTHPRLAGLQKQKTSRPEEKIQKSEGD